MDKCECFSKSRTIYIQINKLFIYVNIKYMDKKTKKEILT